jgi:hypothetical protein
LDFPKARRPSARHTDRAAVALSIRILAYSGQQCSAPPTLPWAQFTSAADASGTLTVSSGPAVETLTLLGQYTVANFSANSDSFGGALNRSAGVELGDTALAAHDLICVQRERGGPQLVKADVAHPLKYRAESVIFGGLTPRGAARCQIDPVRGSDGVSRESRCVCHTVTAARISGIQLCR